MRERENMQISHQSDSFKFAVYNPNSRFLVGEQTNVSSITRSPRIASIAIPPLAPETLHATAATSPTIVKNTLKDPGQW
jgi:hypothetical protein